MYIYRITKVVVNTLNKIQSALGWQLILSNSFLLNYLFMRLLSSLIYYSLFALFMNLKRN